MELNKHWTTSYLPGNNERGHVTLGHPAATQLSASDRDERGIEIQTVDVGTVLIDEEPRVFGCPARDVEHRARLRMRAPNRRRQLAALGWVILEPRVYEILELGRR